MKNASVKRTGDDTWQLMPNSKDVFDLVLVGADIQVKTTTISPAWADFSEAIWPPTGAQLGSSGKTVFDAEGTQVQPTDSDFSPFPTVISDPGGGGNIGIWVNNYRNEPLDSRLQPPADHVLTGVEPAIEPAPAQAVDPSFALSSIKRNNVALGTQPKAGSLINPDANPATGFRYPKNPLLPEGTSSVGGTDPYTPMLRAYANDDVEVRAIVGAVDSVHSFGIQGVNWNAEPSFADSGFRDVQGMGISEHFEMLFKLPPAEVGQTEAVDRYYAPSASSMGINKGAWGIMRTYPTRVEGLASLKHNPAGEHLTSGFYSPPEGVIFRTFEVAVSAACGRSSQNCTLQYSIGGKKVPAWVLRAAAGDWIKLKLTNNIDPRLADQLSTKWTTDKLSANASSDLVKGFGGSVNIGINPRLISYDASQYSGLNVGINNRSRTVAYRETETYIWYAGNISLDENNQRVLTPVEFGGVNLTPSDLLLQASYGLVGALVIEPENATWDSADNNALSAVINDSAGDPLFTEVVILGNTSESLTNVDAGSEIRFRVLNPNKSAAGQVGDSANVITVEGHNWPEEPYIKASEVIATNSISQTLGTQQVTSLESYNLLIQSAGGVAQTAGRYEFYYYPTGKAIGTLNVVDN